MSAVYGPLAAIGEVRVFYINNDGSKYEGHWCLIYDDQDMAAEKERLEGYSCISPVGPVIRYTVREFAIPSEDVAA